MSFIRRNIYLAITAALGLGISLPLAASSDADQMRLKILGVIPAQTAPATEPAASTMEESHEMDEHHDGGMSMMEEDSETDGHHDGDMPMTGASHDMDEHHKSDTSMKEEHSEMDEHHDGGMPMMEEDNETGGHHDGDMPMTGESHDMDEHHKSDTSMKEEHSEMDEHHDEAAGHTSAEKKMMESAHAPAGIKIDKKEKHHSEAHWGYEGSNGPHFWGDLKSEYGTCKDGKQQSPIDISAAIVTTLSRIQTDYRDTPLDIVNNGHTIQVNYQAGSSITIGGKQFELLQFHFHSPSEHTVGGKAYPMVAHLVHKAADGQLGVIGILLKEGQANALIDQIWGHLPPHAGEKAVIEGEAINVSDLLPKDMTYFNYGGSLTTPPCSEGVNWMLLATPVALSAEQIEQFRALYAFNARPIQPVNGRPVGLSN